MCNIFKNNHTLLNTIQTWINSPDNHWCSTKPQSKCSTYKASAAQGPKRSISLIQDSPSMVNATLLLELLNSMFPAQYWENEGKNFKKNISTNPPSREDVNTLQKLLDEKLVYRQARYKCL